MTTSDHDKRIRLQPHQGRVRLCYDDVVIADTRAALELHEQGYPSRLYIPHSDVVPGYLKESSTRTHCPFKGDATYYDVQLGDATLSDAAWSYPEPLAEMAAIARHLCFDHASLTLHR